MQFITHHSHRALSLSVPFIPLPSPPSPSLHPSVLLPRSQHSALTAGPSLLCMVIFILPLCLSCSLSLSLWQWVLDVGTTPRLSLNHCYLVAKIMMAETRDGEMEGWRERERECSSITAASDCIKQSSYAAKGLTRDVVIYPLLLCAFSYTHSEHVWIFIYFSVRFVS